MLVEHEAAAVGAVDHLAGSMRSRPASFPHGVTVAGEAYSCADVRVVDSVVERSHEHCFGMAIDLSERGRSERLAGERLSRRDPDPDHVEIARREAPRWRPAGRP